MGAKKMSLIFHRNCENTGKISCLHVTLHFVKYEIYFLGLPSEIFFQFYWCYYNNNQLLLKPLKTVKNSVINYALYYSGTRLKINITQLSNGFRIKCLLHTMLNTCYV